LLIAAALYHYIEQGAFAAGNLDLPRKVRYKPRKARKPLERTIPSYRTKNLAGKSRTRLFYCDPMASWQKGRLEKNHEFIRYIIPKGCAFEYLTRSDVILMMIYAVV